MFEEIGNVESYYLSSDGRLTLIKLALNNLPIHYLSLYRAPKGVVKEPETLQQNFLWEGREHRKPHMTNGKMFVGPKGMEIRFGRYCNKKCCSLGERY